RDNARSCHQKASQWKAVVAIEVFRQQLRLTFEFRQRGFASEGDLFAARDSEADLRFLRQWIGSKQNAWAKRAAALIDLRLRKVERVFTLDIARAHVVSDGVANDFAAAAQHQSQLRLGDGPLCIAADANLAARADNAAPCGFEEELRALGRIDAVVEI